MAFGKNRLDPAQKQHMVGQVSGPDFLKLSGGVCLQSFGARFCWSWWLPVAGSFGRRSSHMGNRKRRLSPPFSV